MTIRFWKSKEERMHDDANTLMEQADGWISVSGGIKYLSRRDLKWVDETRSRAEALRKAAAGSRYGWEDLLRYVIVPLLIVGAPMLTVYLLVGRNLEQSSLPQSAGVWWSFPLFCGVILPTGLALMWVFDSVYDAIMLPRYQRRIAASNAARDEINAICDRALKAWDSPRPS